MDGLIPGYLHDALFYESDEELLAAAVPFLRAGLDGSDGAVLACADRNATQLAGALQYDPRILLLDRSELYRRVPVAIETIVRTAGDGVSAGADRVRLAGEIDFDRPGWEEWTRFEALSNAVFEPCPLWSVCLYDTRRARAEVLEAARRTHQGLITAAGRVRNPQYVSPAEFFREFAMDRPDPLEATVPAIELDGVIDLALLRQRVRELLAGSGARPETVYGFVFAVSEVATNALEHGRPPVTVRVWTGQDRSVCTVADHGDGFGDPLSGYQPPRDDDTGRGGRGLWMARRMCDVVSAARTSDGFTVRIINHCQP